MEMPKSIVACSEPVARPRSQLRVLVVTSHPDEDALRRLSLGDPSMHCDVRSELPRNRTDEWQGVVLDADCTRAPGSRERLQEGETASRRRIVLFPRPTSRELYELMSSGFDVIDAGGLAECTEHVRSILVSRAPSVHSLAAFCARHRLSPTETRVFFASCAGLRRAEAHSVIGCSARTLEAHWAHIFTKVGVHTAEGVLSAALRSVVTWPCSESARRRARPIARS
jgi:DNA-binding CsgD family transcriptional regulator